MSRPENARRWVLHLPFEAADRAAALELAVAVAGVKAMIPQVDPGEATVSAEDHQNRRTRVFCDRLLAGRRRCRLRDRHDGNCVPGGR